MNYMFSLLKIRKNIFKTIFILILNSKKVFIKQIFLAYIKIKILL